MIAYFYIAVDDARCPQCRENKALSSTREAISKHTCIEEKEHSSQGALKYVGQKKGRKIYDQDIDYWTTEQEIITIEYLVTETCKYCSYTNQYNMKETEKGECIETARWTDVREVRKRVEPEPTYRGDSHTVVDESGRCYHRIPDSDVGSGGNVVKHNGNLYRENN